MLAYIPAPPGSVLRIGPLTIHYYGIVLTLAAIIAVQWSERRWVKRGGVPGDMTSIAIWAVPGGLIGARAYHVITDPELFYGRWIHVFAIWEGGLGIPGGIVGGVGVGIWAARRRGLKVAPLLDVVAPALPLAQAIGRWGNYFNQELFGRPSKLPWALHVDLAYRPAGFTTYSTFQPTFLYEMLWNFALVGALLVVERRVRLRKGRLFAVYIGGYAFGRFWVELLRIDYAHRFFGLRVNDWVSVFAFIGAAIVLIASRGPEPAEEASEQQVAAEAAEPQVAEVPADSAASGSADGEDRETSGDTP